MNKYSALISHRSQSLNNFVKTFTYKYLSTCLGVSRSSLIYQKQNTMGVCNAMCTSKARLVGKTALVTGANTGIGRETVKDFYKRGARVILACRNEEKAKEAAESIKKECEGIEDLGELAVTQLDLTSLKSVRTCAQKVLENEERLDLLINNAGVMMTPFSRTEDGFEMQFGTNHLGHFLLTMLLLPKIIQSTPARIVNVSSYAHEVPTGQRLCFDDLNWEKRSYSAARSYQQSKLANILFTRELAKRLAAKNIEGVNVYSLHPGAIKTELGRYLDDTYFRGMRWLMRNVVSLTFKTPLQGAQTTIYCAVDEKCANETGLYYAECSKEKPHKCARNDEDAERLWEESLVLVGLGKDFDPFKRV